MNFKNITTRDEIPAFLNMKGLTGKWCELGVAQGAYSETLLKNSVQPVLFSIDRWAGDRGHDDMEYINAKKRLCRYGHRSVVIKQTFEEARPLFPNHFFDFIYIDGYAHTGQNGGQTLKDWYKKLKPGGVFAGHDYAERWPKTIIAVDAFVKKFNIPKENFHLTTDDTFNSWLVRKI